LRLAVRPSVYLGNAIILGKAFSGTGLIEIIIPASIEFLGEECFSYCISLSSMTFECSSRLSRIEAKAFL
jgi:hypothetical protein